MPGIYRKVKELRFIKVKDRQVRKFNNLLNKKEGNITWQSSSHIGRQVTPATGASPHVENRQATLASRALSSSQTGWQAGSSGHWGFPSGSIKLTGRQAIKCRGYPSSRGYPSCSSQAGFPSRQHSSPGRE